jgi:hypothetical protein
MKTVLIVILSVFTFVAFGQTTEGEKELIKVSKDTVDGWKKGGFFSLNGTQVSLTNWVAGGQNSVSVNGLFGLYANLKKGPMTWENSFDFGYGIMKQSDKLFSQSDSASKWIKTDDRVDITSKFGRKASEKWYYAGLMNFRTQSTAGYDYAIDDVTEISGFLAPAYLLTAVGMDYKPNDNFSLFVAPLTSKLTFVNDETLADAGAFGVTAAERDAITGQIIAGTGKRFRSEIGGYLRMQYKVKLAPNIDFKTKVDLFSNYANNPSRIDVNWENLLEVKLWKFLSATLSTHLIYDDDINITTVNDAGVQTGFGPRVQFKQVFGLGLSWKFDQK